MEFDQTWMPLCSALHRVVMARIRMPKKGGIEFGLCTLDWVDDSNGDTGFGSHYRPYLHDWISAGVAIAFTLYIFIVRDSKQC